MVDYRRGTGQGSSYLIISDNGSAVEFLIHSADPSTYFGSEAWSGKVNGVNVGGRYAISGVQTVRVGGPWTVNTSQTVTFAIADTGTYGIGGPTSFSQAINRPLPAVPGAPAITRESDTQHRLNWTRNGTYTSVVVQRNTDGGGWQQVGIASGNAYTFTDTTTTANRRYQWRVAARAASGQSGWSGASPTVYTTPAVPSGVSAARSGNDILVSASSVSPNASGVDVRDGATVVATNVVLPWRHVSPNPATPHTYTVRAVRGALASTYSAASNTVQLLTPPNPPTGLTPNGVSVAAGGAQIVAWVHNPVDSSPQASYEVRHRAVGATSWTTLTGTTASSRSLGVLVAGNREWQVRTKGSHPTFSDWSPVAMFEIIDRPGVAIQQPSGVWDASKLTVTWNFFQAQSKPQSAWELRLIDDSLTVVESRSGSGPTSSFTTSTRLTEGAWTVEVRAASGGVWSEWSSELFTVTFNPPALPVVSGVWDDVQGGVALDIAVGVLAGAPATTSISVERSLNGSDWEPVIELTGAAAFIDWEAWSWGDIKYRVTSFSAEGAGSVVVLVVEARSSAVWLSGGASFGLTARLPYDPSVGVTAGRQRTAFQWAGRSLPVVVTGEALSRAVKFGGTIVDGDPDTADGDTLVSIVQDEADLVMFRNPDGVRVFGMLSDVSVTRGSVEVTDTGWSAAWAYSGTVTEATA